MASTSPSMDRLSIMLSESRVSWSSWWHWALYETIFFLQPARYSFQVSSTR